MHIIDCEKRAITWTYGVADTRGSQAGFLIYPDDAHLLGAGQLLTADIRNCRMLFIDTQTQGIATQWGEPGKCRHHPPQQLAHPNGATPMDNGATPMDNGDILVSEITDAWISRITRAGQLVWSVRAPHIPYPSDAFPSVDGRQVIVADFSKPGRVVIFDPKTGKANWEYGVSEGDSLLDHPSLARIAAHRRRADRRRPARPRHRRRPADQGRHLAIRRGRHQGSHAGLAELSRWRRSGPVSRLARRRQVSRQGFAMAPDSFGPAADITSRLICSLVDSPQSDANETHDTALSPMKEKQ